ncbi:MAG: metallophosphoesterase [bacterium]|nr:metallophosphoesterase [bacterium]
MRIVCLSDTHDAHGDLKVPEGDVLVHAGDMSRMGHELEIQAFDDWLGTLAHAHKVVIAGNHDWLFERDPAAARALITNARYLQDSGATIEGVRFWGSPWQPRFFNWAFNLDRGAPLRERWAQIPEATDVLVTHGPPQGVLDRTTRGEPVGCEELDAALARVRPRLHVFGHIHEAYGREERDGTVFVNACNCDLSYEAVNPPIVVDL